MSKEEIGHGIVSEVRRSKFEKVMDMLALLAFGFLAYVIARLAGWL